MISAHKMEKYKCSDNIFNIQQRTILIKNGNKAVFKKLQMLYFINICFLVFLFLQAPQNEIILIISVFMCVSIHKNCNMFAITQ